MKDADILREPLRSEILRDAFGERSRHLATWKVLSDLSHHSYAMGRMLADRSDETTAPVVVFLLAAASSVNDALEEAIAEMTLALTRR